MKNSSRLIPIVLGILICAITACALSGQKRLNVREQETIRQTLEFSSENGTKLLEVDNISGSIRVTGYDGRSIEMTAEKTIRAESQDQLQIAKREVKLDVTDKADTVRIYVD